jgi:hypothetical protein
MLDYNMFLHAMPGFCRYMPHFNVFVTGPVTTGLDRFFAVFCNPGPRSLISEAFWDRTGPDLEALTILSGEILKSTNLKLFQ